MVIYRYLISLISIILLLSALSCGETNWEMKNSGLDPYYISFQDSLIISTLNEYVSDNEINLKKSYLTVNIRKSSFRTKVYISHRIQMLSEVSYTPSYYTRLGDMIVFFYTDMSPYLNDTKIKEYFNDYLDKSNLTIDFQGIHHSATWILNICGESVILEKSVDRNYEVPCGYTVSFEKNNPRVISEQDSL